VRPTTERKNGYDNEQEIAMRTVLISYLSHSQSGLSFYYLLEIPLL
jgi:hypothetical protein